MGSGGKGGGSAPSPPDYMALAKQQAAADKNTAMYTTALDRPNQFSPYGTSSWALRANPEGAPTLNASQMSRLSFLNTEINRLTGKNSATARKNLTKYQNELNALTGGYNIVDPSNPKPGDWTQSTVLTPQEQAVFDAEQRNRLGMENLAGTAMGRAGGIIGQDFAPQLRDFYNAQGLRSGNIGLPEYMQDRVGLAGNTLEGMQDISEGSDAFSAEGQQVRDALYKQLTRFSDERFGKQEAAERSRLAQMGLQEGSQAFNNALSEFRRNMDESYSGAQLQAVLAGGQEQSRLRADQLAARQSNIGLRQGMFGQNMTRDQQDMMERMNMFNTGAQRYQMDLGERQAQATSEMNMANLAAAQRQQQLSEQAYMRSLPINEISALLQGGGVNMPQFSGFAGSTPFNSPDLLGAAQAQYNALMGGYNSGQSQKGSLLGAGAQAFGSYLGGK